MLIPFLFPLIHDSMRKGRIGDICSETILKVRESFIPFINKKYCRQHFGKSILVMWTKRVIDFINRETIKLEHTFQSAACNIFCHDL